MSLPPSMTDQPARGPTLFAAGMPKPAVPAAPKPDPLAAIRAKIKSGEIKAAKSAPAKPQGLFGDTSASATTRLTRLEHIVKNLVARLPSTELTQLTQEVDAIS